MVVCQETRSQTFPLLDTSINRPNSIIETNVAIICACLPCLKALAKRHLGHTWLFKASTQRTVNQALSFLNTRPLEPAAGEGIAELWAGPPSPVEDHMSDKSRVGVAGGSRGEVVEVSECGSSSRGEAKQERGTARVSELC